jgi:hypothetical protein
MYIDDSCLPTYHVTFVVRFDFIFDQPIAIITIYLLIEIKKRHIYLDKCVMFKVNKEEK